MKSLQLCSRSAPVISARIRSISRNFVFTQPYQLIVEADGLEWLHKERSASAARAVNDAVDAALSDRPQSAPRNGLREW